MSKTILFQTDFTLDSLRGVKKILSESTDNSVFTIILLHGLRMDDSINELLFFNKLKKINQLSDTAFKDACKVLTNKYASKIETFEIDLFTGWNQHAFSNYVEAKAVDCIYLTKDEDYKAASSQSFNLSSFFRKSAVPTKLLFEEDNLILQPEKGKLAEIFIL